MNTLTNQKAPSFTSLRSSALVRSMKLTQPFALTLMCSTLLTACGGDSSGSGSTTDPADTAEFSELQANPYYPLASGLVYTYEAVSEDDEDEDDDDIENDDEDDDDNDADDGDTIIQVHYTMETKQVDGINAIAVIEKEYEEGELVEESTKWVAMDVKGAVWLLGETSKSYEEGEVDEQGSWTAGVDGAKRGLLMPASVLVGDSFTIENISADEVTTGFVKSVTDSVSLEDLGDYEKVLHLEETSEDEDGTEVENKYYAQNIGLLRYIDEDETVYELDAIASIVEHDIDTDADTMPTASDEYGEFDDVGFKVAYDSDESTVSVAVAAELDDALEELKIWGPEGKLLARFKAEELEDLGISELLIESGEGTLAAVSDELEEGTYTFLAETTNDELVFGQAELSFDLMDAASINLCDSAVDIDNVVINWSTEEEAESYNVEIAAEDDDIDFELLLEVSSDTTSFTVPASLLESGVTYSVEIGAENEAGNITAAECEFSVN